MVTPPMPRDDEFTFVLLSDRTGLARPGIFERAVEVTNMLRPAFALQLGDSIEGYTVEPDVLDTMWKELDVITDGLEVPFYRVPGNHDVGNEVMRAEWVRRNGPLYYHFRFRDVLFLVLDTQDPPQDLKSMMLPSDGTEVPPKVAALLADLDTQPEHEVIAKLTAMITEDPGALQGLLHSVKSGTQPAAIGEAQIEHMEQAVRGNADVRWTFLCMHMPAWQSAGHPALDRIRAALGDRPYTAFAGHCHNYQRTVLHGRDHIRLGPTGGVRILETDEGDFDHVTAVTMTARGPRIANIVLDGVIGVEGGVFRPSGKPVLVNR